MEKTAAVAFIDGVQTHVSAGVALPDEATDAEQAIVPYVLKLTRTPAAMHEEDVQALREAGLEDGEILDVVHVAGYYAYANRVAAGLGILVEGYRD